MFIFAGTAKTPPVPTNNGVRFGICPKFYTSVEDLNRFPSAETKLKFWIRLVNSSFDSSGKLLEITS